MNNNTNLSPEIISTFISDSLSGLEIIRKAALYVQENELLTVRGFAKMHTLITSANRTMRTIILFNDLIANGDANNDLKTSYCNINKFFTSITNSLNHLFAGGYEVHFKYISKLDNKRTFYINKLCVEKIIYTLIYCLVKNLKGSNKNEVKITFDETSSKNKSYNITITAGGNSLPETLSGLFDKNQKTVSSILDMDIACLHTAIDNAKKLGGTISYKSTKTLNKFIFTIPHVNIFSGNLMETDNSFADIDLLNIFFSDLIENNLPEETKNGD